MYCDNCGSKREGNEKFCQMCGNPFEINTTKNNDNMSNINDFSTSNSNYSDISNYTMGSNQMNDEPFADGSNNMNILNNSSNNNNFNNSNFNGNNFNDNNFNNNNFNNNHFNNNSFNNSNYNNSNFSNMNNFNGSSYSNPKSTKQYKGLKITSLVLGLLGILLVCLPAVSIILFVISIVLGIIYTVKAKRVSIGLILSIAGLLVLFVGWGIYNSIRSTVRDFNDGIDNEFYFNYDDETEYNEEDNSEYNNENNKYNSDDENETNNDMGYKEEDYYGEESVYTEEATIGNLTYRYGSDWKLQKEAQTNTTYLTDGLARFVMLYSKMDVYYEPSQLFNEMMKELEKEADYEILERNYTTDYFESGIKTFEAVVVNNDANVKMRQLVIVDGYDAYVITFMVSELFYDSYENDYNEFVDGLQINNEEKNESMDEGKEKVLGEWDGKSAGYFEFKNNGKCYFYESSEKSMDNVIIGDFTCYDKVMTAGNGYVGGLDIIIEVSEIYMDGEKQAVKDGYALEFIFTETDEKNVYNAKDMATYNYFTVEKVK